VGKWNKKKEKDYSILIVTNVTNVSIIIGITTKYIYIQYQTSHKYLFTSNHFILITDL